MPVKKDKEDFSLLFKWSSPEYEYFEKSPDWFWAVIVISVAVSIAAFILGNFLFGVLAVLSGAAIALHGIKKPRVADFSITAHGITINKRLYAFSSLDSFWIRFDPPREKTLSIKSKKTFMPYILIPLGSSDPNSVRETLIKFIREKEHEESFIDFLVKILRF